MTDKAKANYTHRVATTKGVTVDQHESEVRARAACDDANKRAEQLGIETRYEVLPL